MRGKILIVVCVCFLFGNIFFFLEREKYRDQYEIIKFNCLNEDNYWFVGKIPNIDDKEINTREILTRAFSCLNHPERYYLSSLHKINNDTVEFVMSPLAMLQALRNDSIGLGWDVTGHDYLFRMDLKSKTLTCPVPAVVAPSPVPLGKNAK